MIKFGYFWRKGLWALVSLFFVAVFGIILVCIYIESQLPDVDSLKTIQLQVPLRIYTQDGALIQEYGEKRRIPIAYDHIPKMLIYAVLATEDQRFFEHRGVDAFGLARAALRMVKTGTKSQGGSTITMQVARNFFLDREKTFLRKFNEILLAIKIDHELSKEKILELYLNKIYLGNRAYGVGAAAQIYYGKPLNALNLAQLAMIAGLPQAPSTQNPIINPVSAKKRRDHVLERLLEEKYITKAQYEEAIQQPASALFHGGDIDVSAPYVAEMIRQTLFDHFGQEAYTKGYKVYTTIDSTLQKTANQVVEKHLLSYDRRHGYRGPIAHVDKVDVKSPAALRRALQKYPSFNDIEPAIVVAVHPRSATAVNRNGVRFEIPWKGLSWASPALKKGGWVGNAPDSAKQLFKEGDVISVRYHDKEWQMTQIPEAEAALVALNPKNGAIKALVGGFNFQKSKYNRATQSSRQPGSSFKPFIYAAALEKGYSLATQVNDAPIVIDDPSLGGGVWRPKNAHLTFNGPTRMREGLVHSLNLVSIRILDDIGINYAINFISRFGFNPKNLPHTLSLALGTLTVSPMDLSAAYAVFANGGFKIDPYLIDHVTDNEGKQLLQAKPSSVCASCNIGKTQQQQTAPRVISEEVAFLMHSSLMDVIQRGTGHQATELGRHDIAGKTGTTNDKVDAWFTGYNPDLVVTTWVGFDTPKSLHEYGAQLALPLWTDFMKVALYKKPEQSIPQPQSIVAMTINPNTGLLSTASNAITEYFRQNEIPSKDEGIVTAGAATSSSSANEDLF